MCCESEGRRMTEEASPQTQDVPLCPTEALLGTDPQALPLLQDQTGIPCSDPPFHPHSHHTGPPDHWGHSDHLTNQLLFPPLPSTPTFPLLLSLKPQNPCIGTNF